MIIIKTFPINEKFNCRHITPNQLTQSVYDTLENDIFHAPCNITHKRDWVAYFSPFTKVPKKLYITLILYEYNFGQLTFALK